MSYDFFQGVVHDDRPVHRNTFNYCGKSCFCEGIHIQRKTYATRETHVAKTKILLL